MYRINFFFMDQYPEIEYSKLFETREAAEQYGIVNANLDDLYTFEIEEV